MSRLVTVGPGHESQRIIVLMSLPQSCQGSFIHKIVAVIYNNNNNKNDGLLLHVLIQDFRKHQDVMVKRFIYFSIRLDLDVKP